MSTIKNAIFIVYNWVILNFRRWIALLQENLLYCLPVKKNRVIFSSFCGNNYSCNPRAVFECLYDKCGGTLDYIWMFDYKNNPEIPDELAKKVKCVQFNSFRSSYYKATSKVWCFNHRNTKYFKKKSNQFYIQTWHGDIGFKAIDKLLYEANMLSEPYAKKCIIDSKMTDLIVAGSEWGLNNYRRAFFYEFGEIGEFGCPRNDVLFNSYKQKEIRGRVLEKINICENVKLCLFAPTFRKSFSIAESFVTNEKQVEQLKKALIQRFGGDWVILLKYHPASIYEYDRKSIATGVIDVSDYGDVADLLAVSDALISDYSSISFDYALTNRPSWLYFVDHEEYLEDRLTVLTEDEVAFEIAKSFQDLIFKIHEFDEEANTQKMKEMLLNFGSFEKGNASEQVVSKIISFLN